MKGGWGLALMAVYAQASSASKEGRNTCRDNITRLLDGVPPRCYWLVGGDFNAEVSPGMDSRHREVLGAFGDRRRSVTGEELSEYCRNEGLMVANTLLLQYLSDSGMDCKVALIYLLSNQKTF